MQNQHQTQTISNHYIIRSDLITLLTSLFGVGNFSIEEEDNHYVLTVPKRLTESQINTVRST
ncbi:hypothetical protein T440DRAFT_466358 [Plenodomus tracheiphilus IPT5]|uniref:Uncharacterized protein n=1 Tax=Plenodomus tracheiphilus IPT5 TaxID=1408161 RepID=A0A6A7BBM1_9PLEO|nr:hypothetical protein T440DRAFT_466358 [Plenodomus tracheiphilus IPT5]